MEIKKVSMVIKEQIAEDCANSYFTHNTNGELIGYSEIDKTKTLIYRLIEHYTDTAIPNVTIEENETEEDFILRAYENESRFIDEVVNNGDYDKLKDEIPGEDYYLIWEAIKAKIEFKKKKIEEENSFGKMILKLLQSFLEKAPDSKQMQEIMDNLKDMDLNKLGDVMEIKKMLNV